MKITIKDIAREAGVSTATVSHVINGTKNISEGKTKLIKRIIEKYNYVPDIRAKNLRNLKTKTAGLVVSSFPDSHVSGIVNGVGKRARELGYQMLFINTIEDQEYEMETMKLLSSHMVDGIIITPSKMDSQYLKKYIEQNLPITQVLRYDPNLPQIPKVTMDDFQAGYDATVHLLQHGHHYIGLIYATADVTSTTGRIEGYKAALKDYHLTFNESYLETGNATVEGGLKATKSLINREKQITSLFILNDLMTVGAIQGLTALSLKCPEDIALIGFGDFPAANITCPPITNISMSSETVGQTAFDVLLNKINNPSYSRHIQIPASLMIRRSCGC
ncbi:LacI family transcriptional regulator [Bacillus sp. AFS026049]|nr:LacI family transcriptional regulator [Bacillus sp. AFS026049]